MNFEKFTSKSIQTLELAKASAEERGNQAITNLHFLFALLCDGEGLIPEIMQSLGIDAKELISSVSSELDSLPKVSGAGYSSDRIYLSPTADKMLKGADGYRSELGDEYLSVEHVMLSLLDSKDEKTNMINGVELYKFKNI